MPKKLNENSRALRQQFAARLSEAIGGGNRGEAATKLGVSRQMLNRYLSATATPGGDVIRRACAEWNLTFSVRGFEFTEDTFEGQRKLPEKRAEQLGLFDLLDRIQNEPLQAKIVRREGDSLYLELRLKTGT